MAHMPLVAYIAVELGGIWVAVGALLLHRRDPSRSLYYFGLLIGSAMLIGLSEITSLYCSTNRIPMSPAVHLLTRVVYGAGELLQFYAVIRVAFAVTLKPISRRFARLHLGALILYAAATSILIAKDSMFELTHLPLGGAHLTAAVIMWFNRERIADPRVRRFVYHLVAVTAILAPLVGVSEYTGVASRLPLNSHTMPILYMLTAEIVIAVHAAQAFLSPVPRSAPETPVLWPGEPKGSQDGGSAGKLSKRELDIATLVARGYTNKEIATLLSISHKTVTNHLYHMYRKLGVGNRVELLSELYGPPSFKKSNGTKAPE